MALASAWTMNTCSICSARTYWTSFHCSSMASFNVCFYLFRWTLSTCINCAVFCYAVLSVGTKFVVLLHFIGIIISQVLQITLLCDTSSFLNPKYSQTTDIKFHFGTKSSFNHQINILTCIHILCSFLPLAYLVSPLSFVVRGVRSDWLTSFSRSAWL